MSTSFPLANHTFSVQRRTPGNASLTVITTGLSVLLDMKQGYIDTNKGGQLLTGIYDATCSKNAGILIKDILIDKNEVNVRGEFVQYEVVESFVDALFTNMILHRSDS